VTAVGAGFGVEPDELRLHARNLDAFQARFDRVAAASRHISGDGQAYGLLCAWIGLVLEGRHQRQDGLVTFAARNVSQVSRAIADQAATYEQAEANIGAMVADLHRDLDR
jgi:hypothetical protein